MLDTKTPEMSMNDLTVMLNTLKHFQKEKNFTDLRSRLMAWSTEHNSFLNGQELQGLLQEFRAKCQQTLALTTVDFQAWLQVISCVSASIKVIVSRHSLESKPPDPE